MAKAKVKPSVKTSLDLKRFEEVFKLMKKHAVTEFEWESGAERFFISTQASSSRMTTTYAPGAPVAAVEVQSTQVKEAHKNDKIKEFKSPFVGTFYRSAAPGSEPYAKEGQTVKRGDTLCIIEAMKLMNEIESEMSGKIVSIVAENGQPVEFGEVLFLIEAN